MTLYKKREQFGSLSIKIGMIFSKFGLSPNQWTIVSLIPALAAVFFLANGQFLEAAGCFIVASFLDMVDGSVARVTGRVTRFGAYLDTIIDRYVEALIILGLLFVTLPAVDIPYLPWKVPMTAWLFVYFFGGIMTTYSKAAAKEKNIFVDKELRGGLLERAERLLLLFIGILLAHFDPWLLSVMIIILAVLANISALQRMYIAYKEAKAKKEM